MIKIDLSKVRTDDYIQFLENTTNLPLVLRFVDKAVEGGILDLPMTDLPAILAQFVKALTDEADTIQIAVLSMQKYLKENDSTNNS